MIKYPTKFFYAGRFENIKGIKTLYLYSEIIGLKSKSKA